MRCEELMKKEVAHVTPTDSIQVAAQKMRDANVGFIPVMDERGVVTGTLTDRDIVIRAVAESRAANTPVKQVMTSEVVACRPGYDVARALELMAQRHKSRLLVLDEQNKLRGVISLSDVADRVDAAKAAEALREIAGREARA